jgi:hypothetical protein
MNALVIGSTVLKLLPVITDTIHQVEVLDSSPNKGPQKLQVAITILRGIYNAAEPNPAVTFDQLEGAVKSIISALVEFYNAVGTFTKQVTTQQAAA